MEGYKYIARIEVSLVIEAENREEADEQINTYDASSWITNGVVEDLIDVQLLEDD